MKRDCCLELYEKQDMIPLSAGPGLLHNKEQLNDAEKKSSFPAASKVHVKICCCNW
jgi:hypothetical protein